MLAANDNIALATDFSESLVGLRGMPPADNPIRSLDHTGRCREAVDMNGLKLDAYHNNPLQIRFYRMFSFNYMGTNEDSFLFSENPKQITLNLILLRAGDGVSGGIRRLNVM